ncbi:MAG TPA: four-helix bundle copper-binding protein, partial [Micropepsaceae bacterium]|nr:four-helix bundle copper-binding protein [Micropepsaceae bacterium]
MNQFSVETGQCIEDALRCHAVCLATAMTECLEMGGDHVRPQHYRLMMDCAAICQLAADLMLHKSQFHSRACGLCADICEACAKDCE